MPEVRWPRGVTLHPRSGAMAKSARLRRRRSSQEQLPRIQGVVAAWAQETPEELLYLQGQEGQR